MNYTEEKTRFVFVRPPWLDALRVVARLAYSLAVLGGCTHLVFWRDQSGWLYLLAIVLLWFRRGL